MSNSLLSRGNVCGFSSSPCPLVGLNNSMYMVLSMQFQADSPTEELTVYFSWYNGNFDIPLYLDSVSVRPGSEDVLTDSNPSERNSQRLVSAPLVTRSSIATGITPPSAQPSLIKRTPAISSAVSAPFRECSALNSSISAAPNSSTSISCSRSLPNSTRWSTPPPDITRKTLANSGFEDGLRGWQFLLTGGTFDVATTNQSLEGCSAVSVRPTSPHTGKRRAVTLQTRMTNLNSSHEWYTVELYIGHANITHSPPTGTSPVISMRYKNAISGDIERSTSLCGFARTTTLNGIPQPCRLFGADGAQYQSYGMDVRAFDSSHDRYTNATEMEISVEIAWPAGAVEVPVYVDGVGVWEIKWGSISR
ncbi:uncharacterized protein EKO05_0008814 [Ascochyta rabiei]|nr:uncharacterized protein EKO05_0008814 [Ascochyta rabiei]UPX18515.1 hypothetical protein EKO05_0008814 [Ascochyta rabiei]